MRLVRIILVLLAAVWTSCGSNAPRHEEFAVGMSRAEITAQFGEPESKQDLTKTDESIWGPIESFWTEIPMGATVEIWAFRTTLDGNGGQTELYFVDQSDAVDGIGFHSDAAVYESAGEPATR